jgi:hypothetical protein
MVNLPFSCLGCLERTGLLERFDRSRQLARVQGEFNLTRLSTVPNPPQPSDPVPGQPEPDVPIEEPAPSIPPAGPPPPPTPQPVAC